MLLGRRVSISSRVVAGFLTIASPLIHAHGDDQQILDALTEEIARAPEADLFIRRGELYRQHEEWAKAEADFAAAGKRDLTLAIVDFFRARLMVESGAPAKALPLVERYLQREPGDPEGRLLRGDVLAALGRREAGAADYAEAIRKNENPRPEHYVRWAKFLAAGAAPDTVQLLAVIDEGIARVGPVIALMEYAITLELERKNYDGALTRIDAVMARSARRETWLVRKGGVLEKMGRRAEAVMAYRDALAAIEQLPERFRETVPIEKITREARGALERLEGDSVKR